MKRQEIVEKLESINELKAAEKTEALAKLIESIRPKSTALSTHKSVKFVNANKVDILELKKSVKIPRQMQVIYNHLLAHVTKPVALTELKDMINKDEKLVEELKTRQTPFVIYNFYQKRMEENGMITRTTEQIEKEATA